MKLVCPSSTDEAAAVDTVVFAYAQTLTTREVAKVDPAKLTIAGRTKVGDNLKWGDIDTGGGLVWLRTTDDQTLVVIDPATLAIRARLGEAVGSGALRWSPAGVWTSAHDNQTLSWWSAPKAPK